MEDKKTYLKFTILTIVLITMRLNAFSQDSTKSSFDTTWNFKNISFSISSSMNAEIYLSHSPTTEDSIICKEFKDLIPGEPTEKNYTDYYSLARSLWKSGRLSEAENMFLKIIHSKQKFYTDNYYHSSDIPGDTATNSYGYGSYTSNFKNYSCRYLTKIYLEQKKYTQALKYIELADKKYEVVQNCGTGHRWYREEIDALYGLCYDGLDMYDTIIKKFLPDYSNFDNDILVRVIKKKYTAATINNYLRIAKKSINCSVDSFQSSSYTTYGYGTKEEKTIESKYTSGSATIKLFGMQIDMVTPDLKNGEVVSRKLFLKEFKASEFYKTLIE